MLCLKYTPNPHIEGGVEHILHSVIYEFLEHTSEAIYNNDAHNAVVAVTALCASQEPILRRTRDGGRGMQLDSLYKLAIPLRHQFATGAYVTGGVSLPGL